MLNTKETMVVDKHGVSSGSMSHRENGVGAIQISCMHYDHTSELEATITVWTETPDNKEGGWGYKIFEGSIQDLIRLIEKTSYREVII